MSFRIYTKNYLMIKPELKSKLSSIDDFIFRGGDKTFFRLSNNEAGYWGKKTLGGRGFDKTSLKTAINYLIENCYFNVGNVTIKQAIGIPMGINLAPFWVYFFYISKKENTCHH